MAAAFFDRLPVQLTAPEDELRHHILEAARVAAELFPPGDVVSLQEWADNRMPGEVELGVDAFGLVTLKPLKHVPGKAHDPVLQAFLARLPQDSFYPEEESLREAIVSVVERSPTPLAQVKRDPRVSKVMKVFLPPSIALEDWIERRIGEEVAVDNDDRGQRMCRMMNMKASSHSHSSDRNDDFFRALPKDSFTPQEERLRLSIFDFLAGWGSQELATLDVCARDPRVIEAQRGVFGDRAVSFKEWIERRIGGELTLQLNRGGNLEIHLTPAARPVVAERVALLRSGYPMGPPPGGFMPPPAAPFAPAPPPHRPARSEAQEPPRDRQKNRGRSEAEVAADKRSFFESLPADELLPMELQMREKLLDELDRFGKEGAGGDGPNLSTIATGKAFQKLKQDLLKNKVSLRDWIDRRIGGEIETKIASNGQVIICYRNGELSRAEEPEIDEPMEGAELDAEAQAFFDNLPPDGFLHEEEALREAILTFLEGWQETDPPTLRQAQQTPEIRRWRNDVLNGSQAVSLKMWIDRRIGGEIATWRRDGRAAEISFGLREAWEDEAAAANREEVDLAKRRKLEDGGGGRNSRRGGQGRDGRGR